MHPSSGCGSPGILFELMRSTSVHCSIFYTNMISQLTHIYKLVQSDIIILLQLHVSATSVTIISVAGNKNTINPYHTNVENRVSS
jgi:hypothetical protein